MKIRPLGQLALVAAAGVVLLTGGFYAAALVTPLLVLAGLGLIVERPSLTLVAVGGAAFAAAGLPVHVLDWQPWVFAAALVTAADASLMHTRDAARAWRTTAILAISFVLTFAVAWLFRPIHASLFAPDAGDASTMFLAALGAILALLVTAGPTTPPPPKPLRPAADGE